MMEGYVWIFPLLFIFHDMEEIIGFIPWYQNNKQMLERKYPKISNTYKNISTEGFFYVPFSDGDLPVHKKQNQFIRSILRKR